MSDLSGIILGRYHLLEKLGEGGMATVFKAYDTRLERDVAVKFIRKDVFPPAQLDRILKRFEREAKALAKLSHPNIVNVLDYGEYEGSPFLVMVFLPSGTLKQILGKPIPWQEAANLLLPIARALQFAHKQGIIHRDIKPSNILITLSGEPILSDFGIAKILESGDVASLTGTGLGVGTPEYMAPEQWTGQTTEQSDVYSLGVVFYEMITGRKPYIADTPAALLLKQAHDPLPNPNTYVPDLPENVEKVLVKVLSRNQEDRYPDMASFAKVLGLLLRDSNLSLQSFRTEKEMLSPKNTSVNKSKSPLYLSGQSTIIQEDSRDPASLDKQHSIQNGIENSETFAQEDTREGNNVPQRKKKLLWRNWLWFAGAAIVVLICLSLGGASLGVAFLGGLFAPAKTAPIISQIIKPNNTQSASNPTTSPTFWVPTSTFKFTPATDSLSITDSRRENISSGNAAKLIQLASYSTASNIGSLAISPDGSILAIGHFVSSDKQTSSLISLIDTSNGSILHTLHSHTRTVGTVVFSPDGSILASAAEDATIKLWRVSDGALLYTLASNKENDLAFSPDGEYLASGSGSVQIWRVSDGVPLMHLSTSFIKVSSVAFSPDGATLAALWEYSLSPIVIWQIPSYNKVRVLKAGSGTNYGSHLCFSPDGVNIAAQVGSSTDKRHWEYIWRASDGVLQNTFTWSGVYSPDWSILVSTVNSLEIINASTGSILKSLYSCGEYSDPLVSFSQNSQLLLSGCRYGNNISIWGIS